MENFQKWLILESGLNDVASLRDHNEPMVLLNLDRRLAVPAQVRGYQRQHFR
jgi:hypothetical protein